MKNNFFTPEGWLDIEGLEKACPLANFFIIIGSRQVGKTYGVLDYFHKRKYRYIFMRLTKEEMRMCCTASINMYREKGFPWGEHMTIGKGKPTFIYDDEYKDGTVPIAMALPLSDVAKIRGFGAAGYTHILFDEFIPELTAYQREGQGFAFKNAYITINSNRETDAGGNHPAVKCWMLANSNDLSSDILRAWGWTPYIISMMKKHQTFKYMPEKGLCFLLVNDSPVSAQMSKTAAFRAMGDCDDGFQAMALENVFINEDDTGVGSRPLREYKALCNIDDITIYKHKSRSEWYFVERGERTRNHYNPKNPTEYAQFLTDWKWQGTVYPVDGKNVFYNSYTCKIRMYKLLKLEK